MPVTIGVIARALACGKIGPHAGLDETHDLEPAVRVGLVDPIARLPLLEALELHCDCGTAADLWPKPKRGRGGVDIVFRCARCDLCRAAQLELKRWDTPGNCHILFCRCHFGIGHCQLNGAADIPSAVLSPRGPIWNDGPLCEQHRGWKDPPFRELVSAVAMAGLAAGPGAGDVAVGLARVLASVGYLPEIFDSLHSRPGRLDDQDPPTPEQVLTFCFVSTLRNKSRMGGIGKRLSTFDPALGVDLTQLLRLQFAPGGYVGAYPWPEGSCEYRAVEYESGIVGRPDALVIWTLDGGCETADLRDFDLGDTWDKAAYAAADRNTWMEQMLINRRALYCSEHPPVPSLNGSR